MKAVIFTEYGEADVLHLEEVEKPTPGDDEVLVKVHAVSINSWDWELLRGVPFVNRIMAGLKRPSKITIIGCDIAGRIDAVGKNVKQLQPGDEVFGDISHDGWGGFAEYVAVPEHALSIKPANLSFEQAAAVPQAGLLALQGLRDKGKIQPGQKVLISGASGGSGTFAVQIAKLSGTEVTGVCRTSKMDFVRSVGADHVIDYTQEDFTKNGQQYDLIIDMMNLQHSLFDYLRILSPSGKLVVVGGANSGILQIATLGPLISLFSKRSMGLLLHKANKGLDTMIQMLESGKVVPVIDKVFPLSEAAEAMRYFGAGKAKGKVVITIGENS